jgi:hypothetical protein
MEELNAENLKKQLWETLLGLKSNSVTLQLGNAVAAQSREIVRVIRTEMELRIQADKKPSKKSLEFSPE